jgi:hypothetical protein
MGLSFMVSDTVISLGREFVVVAVRLYPAFGKVLSDGGNAVADLSVRLRHVPFDRGASRAMHFEKSSAFGDSRKLERARNRLSDPSGSDTEADDRPSYVVGIPILCVPTHPLCCDFRNLVPWLGCEVSRFIYRSAPISKRMKHAIRDSALLARATAGNR